MKTEEQATILMEVRGKTADEFIDNLYINIKGAFLYIPLGITVEHIEALAEQLAEFAARKKEEAGGK